MATGVSSTPTVIDYFLAIILPPLAVLLAAGLSADFIINICLTILGWIPGIIHAWWVISRKERYGQAGGVIAPVSNTTAPATAPATATAPGTGTVPNTAY